MANIVIDARELNTTSGRYISKLLEYLQLEDKKSTYRVLLYPKDMETWEPISSNFTKVPCSFKEFTFSEQIGLLLQLRKMKPDLVHFGMVQQPILYMGKKVTTMHDLTGTRFKDPLKNWLIFTIRQEVYKVVNKIVARTSNAIICPTEFVKEDVAKYARINSRKITVTYEAADKIKDLPEPIDSLVNEQFIMYAGRAGAHKNLHRLVNAFTNLNKKHSKLKLVFVGKKDRSHNSLEKFCADAEIKNVIFTGFVSEGQLRWLYENCSAYIFPSLSEGFGLPGLEAMIHGAPVVSSNATCLPEVYGDAAQYFEPTNVDDMAEQIDEVLSNKNMRDELIKKGLRQSAKYSWGNMAEQTLEIYKNIIS